MIHVFAEGRVQMGHDDDGRPAAVLSADDADRILVAVGGAFIHIRFHQAVQKFYGTLFFMEGGGGYLPQKDDIGDYCFFDRAQLFGAVLQLVDIGPHCGSCALNLRNDCAVARACGNSGW